MFFIQTFFLKNTQRPAIWDAADVEISDDGKIKSITVDGVLQDIELPCIYCVYDNNREKDKVYWLAISRDKIVYKLEFNHQTQEITKAKRLTGEKFETVPADIQKLLQNVIPANGYDALVDDGLKHFDESKRMPSDLLTIDEIDCNKACGQ